MTALEILFRSKPAGSCDAPGLLPTDGRDPPGCEGNCRKSCNCPDEGRWLGTPPAPGREGNVLGRDGVVGREGNVLGRDGVVGREGNVLGRDGVVGREGNVLGRDGVVGREGSVLGREGEGREPTLGVDIDGRLGDGLLTDGRLGDGRLIDGERLKDEPRLIDGDRLTEGRAPPPRPPPRPRCARTSPVIMPATAAVTAM